jgi:hypothetical protein
MPVESLLHSAASTSEFGCGQVSDVLPPLPFVSTLQWSHTSVFCCCSTGWLTHWGEGETEASDFASA